MNNKGGRERTQAQGCIKNVFSEIWDELLPVVSTYNQILCYTETKVIMISKQAHYVVMC